MNFLNKILRVARFVFVWLLMLYWAGFIGYTIMHLLRGGLDSVLIWYRHISSSPFLTEWNWRSFVFGQAVILALTVALCRSEWRRIRPR